MAIEAASFAARTMRLAVILSTLDLSGQPAAECAETAPDRSCLGLIHQLLSTLESDIGIAGEHGQKHAGALGAQKVLFSKDLDATALGYVTGLRTPKKTSPMELYRAVQKLEEIESLRITDTLIASDKKAADNGVVRLGYLADGRPVAVKTIMHSSSAEHLLDEARGAKLLSEIGVYPEFHGICRIRGKFSIVTDIFPGDMYIAPGRPSLKTLRQFAEIMRRFDSIGIQALPSMEIYFQVMKSSGDDLLVIDADGFYREFLRGNPAFEAKGRPNWVAHDPFETQQLRREQAEFDQALLKSVPPYSWGKQLSNFVRVAQENDGLIFLQELKAQGGALWRSTSLEIKTDIRLFGTKYPLRIQEFVLND